MRIKDFTESHGGEMANKQSSPKLNTDGVDVKLAKYRSMRDFDTTAEPPGGHKRQSLVALPFVVQKHAASHLHYDFRLGWDGVLKSWAVAKGPSYSVKDRRLAVEVEDHPMEYGGFEGTIPKGQYGGGTVMLWDQGSWRPQPGYEDVGLALKDGSLKFELAGSKLKGKWTLVRMKASDRKSSSKPNWLLIKEHDEYERQGEEVTITDEMPNSVASQRTMEQITEGKTYNQRSTAARGISKIWYRYMINRANRRTPKTPRERKLKASSQSATSKNAEELDKSEEFRGLPKETQAAFYPPQLAIDAPAPPSGNRYLHELKLDGYRIQARKTGTTVALLTRKGLDWTHRMPEVADAVKRLPSKNITLDGEVCVLEADGTTSFAALQASFQENKPGRLTYFVFDLLHLDGRNTRDLSLRNRKSLLERVIQKNDTTLRYSEHIEGSGSTMFAEACRMHAEGIISKSIDAPYRGTRSSAWLKSKCLLEQEFGIVGYTNSTEGPGKIGSLLLAYYESGRLIYAGKTGTGFTQTLKKSLFDQLVKLKIDKAAVEAVPSAVRRGVHWVKPILVAQVRFATWTTDRLVRQAAFLGLREDKSASEVVREGIGMAPAPKRSIGKVTAIANKSLPVRLTHPDKILDPTSRVTKRMLADYFEAVGPLMLPHIAARPTSLVRCPEGVTKPCFFQKHVNSMLPSEIGTVMVNDKKSGKPEPYITLDSVDQLLQLPQLGVLEIHPWGSKNEALDSPDRIIFDLDPDDAIPWEVLVDAALEVRRRLQRAGLKSFLKTTGGKGLHIVAPIQPDHTWAELKDTARRFVMGMERESPELYLTKMTKAARKGKIYLDYLRNERGATAIAPFSPRARAGMHISLPLPWSALKGGSRPVFALADFTQWKSILSKNPWKEISRLHQRLVPDRI